MSEMLIAQAEVTAEALKGLIAAGPMALLLAYACSVLWKDNKAKDADAKAEREKCAAEIKAERDGRLADRDRFEGLIREAMKGDRDGDGKPG